jgi:hypothetical protein
MEKSMAHVDDREKIGEKSVVHCGTCAAYHFNDDGPCPSCGAGAYHQDDWQDDANYADALRTHAEWHAKKARNLKSKADEWERTHPR